MPRDALPDDDQRRVLCEMIADAFVEIRALARETGSPQIEALADAFHNLPREMYGWGSWSRRNARGMLADYQARHHSHRYPGRRDYVARFDETFGAV